MSQRLPLGVQDLLRDRFGSDLQPELTPVSGGCINVTHRIDLGEHSCFLKSGPPQKFEMFRAEAHGLDVLREARAFRVPEVWGFKRDEDQAWLLMEWLEFGSGFSMEEAGHLLAIQHKNASQSHGFECHNHIGATPQNNSLEDDWLTFFGDHRLGAMEKMCASRGIQFSKIDRLLERLSKFFEGRSVTPSLLHGDLWSGNISGLREGGVAIYDPAVHFGDRECDLAMTELFGGFSQSFYSAYHEAYPIDEGYDQRKQLYQLYHIMNHALLFGGGYVGQSQRLIDSLI